MQEYKGYCELALLPVDFLLFMGNILQKVSEYITPDFCTHSLKGKKLKSFTQSIDYITVMCYNISIIINNI